MIEKFNKLYPNGCIMVQRIMMEEPGEPETVKATIYLDADKPELCFTWYWQAETLEEAQNKAVEWTLNLFLNSKQ